jgi:hypothetical protein
MPTNVVLDSSEEVYIEVSAVPRRHQPLNGAWPKVGYMTVWRNNVAVRVYLNEVEVGRIRAALASLEAQAPPPPGDDERRRSPGFDPSRDD